MKLTERTETVKLFLPAAMGWLFVGLLLCLVFEWGNEALLLNMGWMALFWALCLLDLYALISTVEAAIEVMAQSGEKRSAQTIRAFYWGSVKLICLGIFGLILFSSHSIPETGLLAGIGTLMMVPLIGGYRWSKKVLTHA